MKKEEFTALGISEGLAGKAAEASQKELEGFIPKTRFDEVNEAKKKLVVSGDGKIIGLEEQVKSLQETKAFLFKSEDNGSYKPQNGGRPASNPFAKETFNLTEQGKLLRENPAQAKEMAAAVGVTI